jgi:hypothetical protein
MICSVCCGTKRLVEIDCPDDCPHLATSRQHPPSVTLRQQERDLAALLPSIQHLTERQYQLFALFNAHIARHTPEGFVRLVDDDVADAAAAMAATFETASRGVIYEHAPQSLPAQRLVTDLNALLASMREKGARIFDSEAAVALRAIERGARETRTRTDGGDVAYLQLTARLLQLNRAARADAATSPRPGSSLILP